MSTHALSLVVCGKGDDPSNPSHWSFNFHPIFSQTGTQLQVLIIDPDHLWYQFDKRDGAPILAPESEGHFQIATFTPTQYARASDIICNEPAPRNGRDRCQDWIVNCLIGLEAEEVVPAGTAERIGDLVGKTASMVAHAVGEDWVPNRP